MGEYGAFRRVADVIRVSSLHLEIVYRHPLRIKRSRNENNAFVLGIAANRTERNRFRMLEAEIPDVKAMTRRAATFELLAVRSLKFQCLNRLRVILCFPCRTLIFTLSYIIVSHPVLITSGKPILFISFVVIRAYFY